MYPIIKAIPDREGSNPFNSIHKPKENVTLKLTATEQWNVPTHTYIDGTIVPTLIG